MSRVFFLLVLSLVPILVAGCASVSVKHIDGQDGLRTHINRNKNDMGIIYYEPRLVLVVGCDPKGARTFSVKTMPDYDRPRAIEWTTGLFGSSKPSFNLADGWRLDGFSSEANSGMSAVAEVLGTLGNTLIGQLFKGEKKESQPLLKPGIYSMHWNSAPGIERGTWSLKSNVPPKESDDPPKESNFPEPEIPFGDCEGPSDAGQSQ